MFHCRTGNVKAPKHILAEVRRAITLAVILSLCYLATRAANILPAAHASSAKHRTYTTNFPRAENPLSESGKMGERRDGRPRLDQRPDNPGVGFWD